MAYSRARHLSTILLASGRVKRASSNWGDGTNAITLANLPTITNAKLDNASVTINSVATALGTSADENIQDLVGAMFTSNTETGITVTYEDGDGTIDLVIGTLNQNTTGSAATLTTARTIGGVSFDGSANINLPGVNAAGNQNTTGSAATLTTARTIGGTSFDGSANIAVGLAATATALATARTIGGVSFDGTANINLPGVNAAGNQNTTGTAATVTTAAQPAITSVGTLTTLTVDDITINGSTVSDSGDFLLDVGGDIYLDAAGAEIYFSASGGTGSTVGYLSMAANNITLKSGVSDADIIFQGNDGGSGITALTLDMSAAGAATFNAGVTATTFTGALASTVTATTPSANDNTTKVATTAYVQTELTDLINGAPGTLDTLNELAAAINDDANYNSTLTTALATKLPLAGGTMTGDLILGDNLKLEIGSASGGDLQIYHSGTYNRNYIQATGSNHDLTIAGDEIAFTNSAISETLAKFIADGATELYYNNVEHFATTTGGAEMKNAKHLYFQDNGKAIFGGGSDLQIYHDGTHSFIKDAGTGNLRLAADEFRVTNAAVSETIISASENDGVDLYFNDSKKFETTNTGVTVTGQTITTAGAVSAPSYSFIGDTNTGISRPTSDAVNIVTGGAEVMRIDSAGNVGIGTTSPAAELHVYSAGQAIARVEGANQYYSGLMIRNNHSSVQSQWHVAAAGGTSGWGATSGNFIIRDDTTNSTGIEIEKGAGGASGALYIDADGKVGIGVDPSYVLHTKSSDSINTWLQSTHATDCKLQFSSATTDDYSRISAIAGLLKYEADIAGAVASSGHQWLVDGGVKMTMLASGNVGIGTATPDGPLHVMSASAGSVSAHASADELVVEGSGNAGINILSANNGEGGIYFGDDGDNDIGRIRYDHTNNSLDFFANAAERMSIASDGAVTIAGHANLQSTVDMTGVFKSNSTMSISGGSGYFSPAASLHVRQSSADDNDTGLIVETTDDAERTRIVLKNGHASSGDGLIALNYYGFSMGWVGTEQVINIGRGSSNVGIGMGNTQPSQPLEILKAGGAKIRLSETAARCVDIGGYASGTANGSTMIFSTIQSGTSTMTERMYIDQFGLVKIKSSGGEERFQFQPDTNANQAQFKMYGTDGSTERVHLDSYGDSWVLPESGQFGIGTTSPTQQLEVEGDVKINDARSLFFKRHGDHYAWRIRNESASDGSTYGFSGNNTLTFEVVSNSNHLGTPADGSHTIYGSSGNTLALKESGRVGVGTNQPAQKFHVSAGHMRLDTGYALLWDDTHERIEQSNGVLEFFTNNGQAMTLSGSYLGIGTTTPGNPLVLSASSGETGPNKASTTLYVTGSNAAGKYNGIGFMYHGGHGSEPAAWIGHETNTWTESTHSDLVFATRNVTTNTAPTERMRITSAGIVQVGTTNTVNVGGGDANVVTDESFGINDGSNQVNYKLDRINFNAGNYYVLNESSAGVRLVNGNTAWQTQSDETLKENIIELTDVLPKVKDMRCVTYNLKSQSADRKKIGFIAQDWQGDFDQVIDADEDGTLGMRYTETIPVLLKAIQEQQEMIEILKDRIAALENN